MAVRALKLITGEEIVAQVENADTISAFDHGITLKNPLVLHVMKGKDGAPLAGFAQWSIMALADQEINIPMSAILSLPSEILPEFEHSYLENTTGLDIPPPVTQQKILLG